ncbi:hypothetical protein BpHYR1_016575 [Brachionus plicatilis]|uniref:Uncharacterized protein n=1 Tax=Brachionus plicatilis TaxID=10195 RepID=A0A3M7QM00_BRAPC|nr:hypothetical protein BpHYR1_016575 [Brachionus plicatilis]
MTQFEEILHIITRLYSIKMNPNFLAKLYLKTYLFYYLTHFKKSPGLRKFRFISLTTWHYESLVSFRRFPFGISDALIINLFLGLNLFTRTGTYFIFGSY